ncbi:DNA-binding NtrC family response regulator [Methanomicrobium sp. W14]|uniref:response regulator n=1 Tax=Methanomicrobium sp. W14 TaxID=2817839 RepID=UPI001AE183F6|nr:response regulator [Methanomicrobium sp. W14]MBP2133032.1 DNA-binding NtrC family response regulator [Methanomicrobium sp. W14]
MASSKILLMDDESPILDIMKLFLTRGGYNVVCSSTGSQALDIFSKNYDSGDKFDMAILDVSVPGDVGAKEIVGPMREIDSDIKVIITSGDSAQGAMDKPKEYGFCGALKKPFRSENLLNIVREALS